MIEPYDTVITKLSSFISRRIPAKKKRERKKSQLSLRIYTYHILHVQLDDNQENQAPLLSAVVVCGTSRFLLHINFPVQEHRIGEPSFYASTLQAR